MKRIILGLVVLFSLEANCADTDDRFAQVQISSEKVADGIYMLSGAGGNMGLCIGEDGTFLIDDQFAPLSEKILQHIKSLGGSQPEFLINTHWHGDHTGGNEAMGKAGSKIVAHQNVRKRLTSDQFVAAFNMKTTAQPKVALPIITFSDELNFYWNGQQINVRHVDQAHTDGDSFIHFVEANVIHAGDVLFSGMYPFIDPDGGGSISGMIAAADQILVLCNSETRIIPGHGKLATADELLAYRDMLVTVRGRIAKMIAEGKTEQQVVASKPTADLDQLWGNGALKPDNWVAIVYQGMTDD